MVKGGEPLPDGVHIMSKHFELIVSGDIEPAASVFLSRSCFG